MNRDESRYFEWFSRNLQNKRSYVTLLKDFKSYMEKDLKKATSEDISSYLSSLKNNNNTKRRKYHQLLSFYNFLFDEMIIDSNPVRKVTAPKASKQVKIERTLKFENLKKLLEVLKEHFHYRDYLITLIIATTGMKLGEARNLKWSDFFIDNNGLIGARVGNKKNQRYVRIFNFVWEALIEYKVKYLEVGDNYLKEDFIIFFSDYQLTLYKTSPKIVKPISTDWLKKTYTKACEMLEIPLVTAKDIRHNYAMLSMKLGSESEEIKDQLGWSSTQFIYRYNGVVEQLNSPVNKKVEEYYIDLLGKTEKELDK